MPIVLRAWIVDHPDPGPVLHGEKDILVQVMDPVDRAAALVSDAVGQDVGDVNRDVLPVGGVLHPFQVDEHSMGAGCWLFGDALSATQTRVLC